VEIAMVLGVGGLKEFIHIQIQYWDKEINMLVSVVFSYFKISFKSVINSPPLPINVTIISDY